MNRIHAERCPVVCQGSIVFGQGINFSEGCFGGNKFAQIEDDDRSLSFGEALPLTTLDLAGYRHVLPGFLQPRSATASLTSARTRRSTRRWTRNCPPSTPSANCTDSSATTAISHSRKH